LDLRQRKQQDNDEQNCSEEFHNLNSSLLLLGWMDGW